MSDTHETDARPDDVVVESVEVEETVLADADGDVVDQVVTETVAVDADGDVMEAAEVRILARLGLCDPY